MIYEWKQGARVGKLDAQEVGDRLQLISVRYGAVTPALVVKEAKKKRSPLHGGFEWDDRAAAVEYRLEQARSVIRSVVVLRECPDGENKPVRAFVYVGEGSEYEEIDIVLSVASKREALLLRARVEMEMFQRKYEVLEELASVFAAIDEVLV